MKKLLALLLVMVMLLGTFAGCGKKDATTNNTDETGKTAVNQQNKPADGTDASTEPNPDRNFGVALGTELDAPEKVFTSDGLQMLYVSFDQLVAGKTENTEISVVVKEDGTTLIFSVNGPGKNKEAIYEITEAGVAKYIKGSGKNPYKPATSTPEEITVETEILNSYLKMLTQYQDVFTGFKYRKASDLGVGCATGDAWVYDVIADGKVVGQVCVDKATGMLVKAKDLTNGTAATRFYIDDVTGLLTQRTGEEDAKELNTTLISVLKVATANVEIPAYSNGDEPAEGETETPAEGETETPNENEAPAENDQGAETPEA